tara:strand:+ start:854 stop:1186 length:333 start_codon:yes stop_codon:yes gene_type:complete
MLNRQQSKKQPKVKTAPAVLPDFRKPMTPFNFYIAYWKDIESDPTWRSLKDIQASKPAVCISTGWLVKKDKENHVLMSDFNFGKDGEIGDGGSSTVIPSANVLKLIQVKI